MARLVRQVGQRVGQNPLIVGSANGTWLDRVEGGAAQRAGAAIRSTYGHVAECFSALPLAGIAAVLLTGQAPRPPGSAGGRTEPLLPGQAFCAVGADYSGVVSGVSLEPLEE
jgi:hypothetical protein